MKFKAIFCLLLLGFICYACGSDEINHKSDQPRNILGEKVFKRNCIACHGLDGKAKTNGALDITESQLSMEERILLIKNGRKTMTPFKSMLSEKEIKAVAEYTFRLK